MAEKIAPIPTTPLYNYNPLSASNVSGDVVSKPLETFVNTPDTSTPTTRLYDYNKLPQSTGGTSAPVAGLKPPLREAVYDKNGKLIGYNVTTYNADGSANAPTFEAAPGGGIDDSARKDAFALLVDTFKSYGLDSLADTIKGYMTQNIGPNEATLLLKQTQAYKDRFAGNETRVAAGKNAIGESTYLALENQYAEVLKAYGQNALGNRAEYATLIGNDISNIELGDRLKLAVTRVQQSDPSVKAQLKQFYPSITDADLVSYFLKPDQTLPGLERKVTSAEIGAAATSQGLNTSATSAEDLAAFGVDRSTALKGYSTIGTILPEGQKLSSIYGEAKIDYTQATAEQEVFKGNASAERKRKQLAALETAQFSGSAGLGSAGLSTTYLRKSSSGGQF